MLLYLFDVSIVIFNLIPLAPHPPTGVWRGYQ